MKRWLVWGAMLLASAVATPALADGSRAVALLNRGTAPARIAIDWAAIGYPSALAATVRDLWARKDVAQSIGRYAATVRPHAAMIVKITPVPSSANQQETP